MTPDSLTATAASGGALISEINTLLALALVLAIGVVFGHLAKKLHLPSITGQIIAGVLIGPSMLHLLDRQVVHGLAPITHFALGLMAVTIGAHLHLRRLRNAGKRLLSLWLAEATVTPALVFFALLYLPGVTAGTAGIFAAIAIATAPATIVALVKETRSKGVFVKTLVAAVALNNVACMVMFEIARTLARLEWTETRPGNLVSLVLLALMPLVLSAVLGAVAALTMDAFSHLIDSPEQLATSGAITILITAGLASELELSPLLACLVLGFVQSNRSPAREKLVDRVFDTFETAILAIFFTLAGLELSFDRFAQAGMIAGVYFLARGAGKLLSVSLSMRAVGATDAVRRYLGLALLPQAGLAIGLVILLQEDPALIGHQDVIDLIVAVVLTAVTLNEIIGPILTRLGLSRSGEMGRDRDRLLDFLHEEHIITGLEAKSMEDAIGQMVDRLCIVHHATGQERDDLLESVLEREGEASTCLGEGLAVPHGLLPGTDGMRGVMALCSQGLDLDAPDGKSVRCLILLATPDDERDRHLEVLAALARVIGGDSKVQEQLYNADSPAHAYEVLHGHRTEGFNYFTDEESLV